MNPLSVWAICVFSVIGLAIVCWTVHCTIVRLAEIKHSRPPELLHEVGHGLLWRYETRETPSDETFKSQPPYQRQGSSC